MSRNKIDKEEQQAKRQKLSLSTWRKCSLSPSDEVSKSNEETKKEINKVETKKPKLLETTKKVPLEPELSKSYDPGIRVYAGFSNMGNTCFLSSILHVLRFTPSFLCQLHHLCQMIKHITDTVLKKEKIPSNWKLILELHQVFVTAREIEVSTERTEDPNQEEIYSADNQFGFFPQDLLFYLQNLNPIFKGASQHDAHELLCWFLNTIQEVTSDVWHIAKDEIIKNTENEDGREEMMQENSQRNKKIDNGVECIKNFISDTFKGSMAIETRCAECENITAIKDSFLNIGIPPEQVLIEGVEMPEVISKVILKGHILQGDNKYWCDNCVHYNEALQSVQFKHMPPILIIHIERFSNDVSFGTSKISAFIPTPFELDCILDHNSCPCDRAEHRYFLYAVVTHSGISLSSGHYTAAIKVKQNGSLCTVPDGIETFENVQSYSRNFCQKFKNLCTCKEGQETLKPRTTDRLKNGSIKSLNYICPHTECCNPFLCKSRSCNMFSDNNFIWIDCDDDQCNYLSDEEIISKFSSSAKGSNSTPYLLFYTRQVLTDCK